ncbi:MAG: hypothetical protein LKF52_11910 [Butyrivibrio sp.]|jgi:hypothetical protein|nr:hypothetical protein [Butyrivibrio sp.]
MDSKVVRLAILTFISLIALILVVVYATNTDRIHALINGGADASAQVSSSVAGVSVTAYGEQIGDNLKSFLSDETFFDKDDILQQVVSEDVQSVALEAEAGEGSITAKVINDRSGLETGIPFVVSVTTGRSGAKQKLYTDTDCNGMIEINHLKTGSYLVTLQSMDGYHVPLTGSMVEVTEPEKKEITGIADSAATAQSGEMQETGISDEAPADATASANKERSTQGLSRP